MFNWRPAYVSILWLVLTVVGGWLRMTGSFGQAPALQMLGFSLGALALGLTLTWTLGLYAYCRARLGEAGKAPIWFWLAVGGLIAALIAGPIELFVDPGVMVGSNDVSAALALPPMFVWVWVAARAFARAQDPLTPPRLSEIFLSWIWIFFLPFTIWGLRERALRMTASSLAENVS